MLQESVFDEDCSTQNIFDKIAIPLIDSFFAGMNGIDIN